MIGDQKGSFVIDIIWYEKEQTIYLSMRKSPYFCCFFMNSENSSGELVANFLHERNPWVHLKGRGPIAADLITAESLTNERDLWTSNCERAIEWELVDRVGVGRLIGCGLKGSIVADGEMRRKKSFPAKISAFPTNTKHTDGHKRTCVYSTQYPCHWRCWVYVRNQYFSA